MTGGERLEFAATLMVGCCIVTGALALAVALVAMLVAAFR